MYAAEGSDWFWWYGKDQQSSLEGAFDEIFRTTLANVYTLVGETPPAFLSESVLLEEADPAAGGGGVMARAESAEDAELLAGPVVIDRRACSSATLTRRHRPCIWQASSTAGTPTATAMSDDDGDGVWTGLLELEPGRYEYKFVVDGASWEPDAGNPESVGDNRTAARTRSSWSSRFGARSERRVRSVFWDGEQARGRGSVACPATAAWQRQRA